MLENIKKYINYETITIASLLTLIVGIGIVAKNQIDLKEQQDLIQKTIIPFKELKDEIARSQSQLVTTDQLNKALKSNINIDDIKKDIASLNSKIEAGNFVKVISTGYTDTKGSDHVIPNQNPNPPSTDTLKDEYGYFVNEQEIDVLEHFPNKPVPIGSISFSAWKKDPWKLTIPNRQYKTTTVIAEDEDGRKTTYNKFIIVSDNQSYDIQIAEANLLQQLPEDHFSYWNPRLMMGINTGINISQLNGNISPSLDFSMMSYGKTKYQPTWSFIQVGIGYDGISKSPEIIFTPATYNVGRLLNPLLQNIHLGPSVSVNTKGNISALFSMKVAL